MTNKRLDEISAIPRELIGMNTKGHRLPFSINGIVVLRYFTNNRRGFFECICHCGKTFSPRSEKFSHRRKYPKSCGCLFTAHDLSKTPYFHIWWNMKQRCSSKKDKAYSSYGGRGIKVCKRWVNSLANFYADMGPRPKGYSLDRIDNNGNYEPSNCRWASHKDQCRNKRTNVNITAFGKTQCLTDWSIESGINKSTIYSRLKRGETIEMALTQKPRPGSQRKVSRGNS